MRSYVYLAERAHPEPLRARFGDYLSGATDGIDAHKDPDEQVRLFYLVHGFVAVHPEFLPAYSVLLDSAFVDEFPGMREELVERAAEEVLALISDRNGTFPASMPYDAGDNSMLFSHLHEASLLWWQYSTSEAGSKDVMSEFPLEVEDVVGRSEDREDAINLLENLLFADPSDPLDVRFPLLALLEGMGLSEFVRRFPWTADAGYPAGVEPWFQEHALAHRSRFPKEVLH
jgi:hypothetical protein